MHDIVPDTFRFISDFMPSLKMQWRNSACASGASSSRTGRSRAAGHSTPHHRSSACARWTRQPFQPILDQARTHLTAAFPAFRDMKIAENWGGVIDVTPDGVPVISGVDTLPGFFIATGFTGHGFGIGPAPAA